METVLLVAGPTGIGKYTFLAYAADFWPPSRRPFPYSELYNTVEGVRGARGFCLRADDIGAGVVVHVDLCTPVRALKPSTREELLSALTAPLFADWYDLRQNVSNARTVEVVTLYLRPDLLRMEYARNFKTVLPEIETEYQHLRMVGDVGIGRQAQDVSASGVAGNAAIGTAETGEAIVMHCASAFAELFAEVSSYPLARIANHPSVPGTP